MRTLSVRGQRGGKRRGNDQGDNLYAAGIVAVDAETGRYAWHYQENPRDSWDYDSTQQMTATTLSIGGKPRQVLMHAPKNGFLYVLDRTDGKIISAENREKLVNTLNAHMREPLLPGRSYWMRIGTQWVTATVSTIKHKPSATHASPAPNTTL